MTNVREILNAKGADVWSVTPDATVLEALQIMADRDVGAILVREGGRVVGIVTERDYARKITLLNRRSKNTPVRDVMSGRVLCVEPATTVEECMALMTDKRVRHLPVLDGGELAGVVSIGDVVKAIISEKEFLIDQLTRYIQEGS
jgi:CBS domain-containing protein